MSISNVGPSQITQVVPTTATTTPSLTTQKPSAEISGSTLAKPIESLSTKNADGTYGPKHTLHAPGFTPDQPSNVVNISA
jgi:hypothetical protein